MKVTAIIPTRGDVDLRPIVDTFPAEWEVLVWGNLQDLPHWQGLDRVRWCADMSVINRMGSGRHAALTFATGDLIYTQDDDVIVGDPQAIVVGWIRGYNRALDANESVNEHIACNMPQEFRPHYPDSAMLGFGAVYHRSLPPAVFARFFAATGLTEDDPLFMRESDRALTVLAPRVLVDVPKEDREFANDENRLWKQPDHVEMRERMLTLARKVRDEG